MIQHSLLKILLAGIALQHLFAATDTIAQDKTKTPAKSLKSATELPGQETPLDKAVANMLSAFEAGDWQKVTQIVSREPKRGVTELSDQELFCAGFSYWKLDQSNSALGFLVEHRRRMPESISTAEVLAEVAYRRNRVDLLEDCLKDFPNNPRILVAAAKSARYRAQRELDRELPVNHKEYSTLRNVPPGRSKAKELLASAGEHLSLAIFNNPQEYEAHIQLAILKNDLSRNTETIQHLIDANEINPLTQQQYMDLAELYLEQGQLEEAMESVSMAIKVRPKMFPEFVMLRAEIYSRMGRFDKAIEDLKTVFRADHNHRTVRRKLGEAALSNGNYPLAIFAFRQSYSVDSNLYSLAKIGDCAFELGLDQLAIHYVELAIQKSEEKAKFKISVPADWLFTRGRAKWNLDKKLDGADDLLQAVKKDPRDPEKVRWAMMAFKELNDPHGLIDVAEAWGMYGNTAEGIKVLQYITETWPRPIAKNHRGESVTHHRRRVLYALARLLDKDGRYKSAYSSWYRASYYWTTWSSWLAVRAGDYTAAIRGFRTVKSSDSESAQQHGHVGVAFLEIWEKDSKSALRSTAKIDKAPFVGIKPTLENYAAAILEPSKIEQFGVFDLTGILGFQFRTQNGKKGLLIKALLPGSPLTATVPFVRPNDIVLAINDLEMDAADRIQHFRKQMVADDDVTLTIMRGENVFDVRFSA